MLKFKTGTKGARHKIESQQDKQFGCADDSLVACFTDRLSSTFAEPAWQRPGCEAVFCDGSKSSTSKFSIFELPTNDRVCGCIGTPFLRRTHRLGSVVGPKNSDSNSRVSAIGILYFTQGACEDATCCLCCVTMPLQWCPRKSWSFCQQGNQFRISPLFWCYFNVGTLGSGLFNLRPLENSLRTAFSDGGTWSVPRTPRCPGSRDATYPCPSHLGILHSEPLSSRSENMQLESGRNTGEAGKDHA